MTSAWVLPLGVAGVVGLVATPVARHLAISTGFVDRPAARKSHRREMPYLGGVAIAVAVFGGYLAGRGSLTGALVIGYASVLVVVGLLDDDHTVSPLLRIGVELACGAAALAAGVRLAGVGVGILGSLGTVVLLAGTANSVNLLDNLDGLAAGVIAAGMAGVLSLAVLSGDSATVLTSACVLGACLAFLVFNARPASIFMGDAGSLFLGFMLAAASIRAGQSLPAPASLAFPLLILALPIADTSTVILARIRNGRSPFQGGRDHLSHRLARASLGEGRAVAVLVAVEVILVSLAVVGARGLVPLWVSVVTGLGVILVLLVAAGRVRVYPKEPTGFPRWLTIGLPGVLVVVAGLSVPALLGALSARGPALAGEVSAQAALAAAQEGKLSLAAADFATAKAQFSRAESALGGPLVSIGLAYPVLSTNLAATRLVVSAGAQLAGIGTELALATDRFKYQVRGGTLPVAELASTAPQFENALRVVGEVTAKVDSLSGTYLLPPVVGALGRLRHTLQLAERRVAAASGVATHVPALLGLNGPKRYFLAMQTNSESRATGGLIGFVGLLTADRGHLQLTNLGPVGRLNGPPGSRRVLRAPPDYLARYAQFDPASNWQNVNMSPDFPTVASVIAGLYPQSGGVAVNGVVAIDPMGLAGLLELTGPVAVKGWPVPITSSNVAAVTLNQSYIAYGSSEAARQQFLANIVHAVFSVLSRISPTDPSQLVTDLAPAIRERHIQIYSTQPADQAYLASLGATGAMTPVVSDSLELTTQNAAGNKIDYYLRRSIDYEIRLNPDPGAGTASITGTVSVSLDNTAPSSGLPRSVIGPYEPGLLPGENRSFVTVYTPLGFSGVTVNGQTSGLNSMTELGRSADSTFVDIPARSTVTLQMHLLGQVRLLRGGWYELDLGSQPLITPDQVRIGIGLVPGWDVVAVRGAVRTGPDSVRAVLSVDSEQRIWVRVARTP